MANDAVKCAGCEAAEGEPHAPGCSYLSYQLGFANGRAASAQEIADLKAALAEARKDAERLDWLHRKACTLCGVDPKWSARDAIDAARREG